MSRLHWGVEMHICALLTLHSFSPSLARGWLVFVFLCLFTLLGASCRLGGWSNVLYVGFQIQLTRRSVWVCLNNSPLTICLPTWDMLSIKNLEINRYGLETNVLIVWRFWWQILKKECANTNIKGTVSQPCDNIIFYSMKTGLVKYVFFAKGVNDVLVVLLQDIGRFCCLPLEDDECVVGKESSPCH